MGSSVAVCKHLYSAWERNLAAAPPSRPGVATVGSNEPAITPAASRRSRAASSARPLGAVRFRRSASNRALVGVAGGIGERTGIDPAIVRAALLVLCLGGGLGLVLYCLAWAVSAEPSPEPQPRLPVTPNELRQVFALGFIVLGLLLFARRAGLWFGDVVVWPLSLATFGATVIWVRSDRSDSAGAANPLEHLIGGRLSPGRIAVGGLFIAAGVGTALSGATPVDRGDVLPMFVTVAGLSLLFGPWLWRLGQQLGEERRDRIRSEQRSEMAAHLHDSVLQTLALIQRAEDPREMWALARAQERELRAWLFGPSRAPTDSLALAAESLAARIEQRHQVVIETVIVGDLPVDDRVVALLEAASEATVNAAKHSKTLSISVYFEVEPDVVTAYVRDKGCGFEPERVPADRGGIAESIRARMERNGGRAEIHSSPGEGTEVKLSLPLRHSP
jgi:signal transduction histidine kinase/phage shock protein PspC (stress-responsive transcriptional regulator)